MLKNTKKKIPKGRINQLNKYHQVPLYSPIPLCRSVGESWIIVENVFWFSKCCWKVKLLAVYNKDQKQTRQYSKKYKRNMKNFSAVSDRNFDQNIWLKIVISLHNSTIGNFFWRWGEAELRDTIWFVSWDRRSQSTFETMFGDVIDTFRITAPTLNQKFVPKSQIEICGYLSVSYSKTWFSIKSFLS